MEWKEFSAKTVEDAVMDAALSLGTSRDNIDYDVIQEPKSGFLGIGSKNAVIRACVKNVAENPMDEVAGFNKIVDDFKNTSLERRNDKKPEKKPVQEKKPEVKQEKKQAPVQKPKQQEKKPAPMPKQEPKKEVSEPVVKAETPAEEKPAKPKTPIAPETLTAVEVFLKDVFAAMKLDVEIKVSASKDDREIAVELSGEDMGVMIGKRGQTLDSLQYLSSLVANKGTNEYIRVKVDTENYRERRKETLENLAKNIAFKVKRTRKAVTLEPMNPYERRVIHSALQNDKFVCTHSEGEEPYRHVVVTLKDGVKLENNYRKKNNFHRGGRRRPNNNNHKKEQNS